MRQSVNYLIICLLCTCSLVVKSDVTELNESTLSATALTESTTLSNEEISVLKNATKARMLTECQTPNGDVAYCQEIKSCEILLNQLTNKQAKAFLRASMCGPENEDRHNPKVCCGKYPNYRNKTSPTNTVHLPKNCGTQKIFFKSRIFGGKEASLGEFPWMARLIHKSNGGQKSYGCSGFLIHSKYILTAAHCVHENFTRLRGQLNSVALGEHNIKTEIDCAGKTCADPLQIIRVAKVIIHPEYDPLSNGHYNDIALIYLKKGVQKSAFVSPICLLQNKRRKSSSYIISGWGKTETESVSKIKMKVELPSVDKFICQEKYSLLNIELKDTQVCVGGEKNRDSCNGDSGGPLMILNDSKWFAAGLVSFGVGCGYEGWPGVYTSIPHYIPWVEKKISQTISLNLKNSRGAKKMLRNRMRGRPTRVVTD